MPLARKVIRKGYSTGITVEIHEGSVDVLSGEDGVNARIQFQYKEALELADLINQILVNDGFYQE